jgi:hypothetical protein
MISSAGVWRSLVARLVRDEEAGGSNPLTPTIRLRKSFGVILRKSMPLKAHARADGASKTSTPSFTSVPLLVNVKIV